VQNLAKIGFLLKPNPTNPTNPTKTTSTHNVLSTTKTTDWGVWKTRDLCCSPGLAFPDGCSTRPKQCWVAESFNLRTCVRDDRKCLQGYGVFPSEAACCAQGAAFPDGCARNLTIGDKPCYVVSTYYPARTCRATKVACDARGQTVRVCGERMFWGAYRVGFERNRHKSA
jgi:hypothetical protein